MDSDPLDLNFELKGDLGGCLEAALQESVPNRGSPAARLAHRDPARQFLRRARKTLPPAQPSLQIVGRLCCCGPTEHNISSDFEEGRESAGAATAGAEGKGRRYSSVCGAGVELWSEGRTALRLEDDNNRRCLSKRI